MQNINELLDMAKSLRAFTSDRQLADALGVRHVHPYRTKGKIPNDETAIKLAELCNLPAEQVLIACHIAAAEKGQNPEVMATWRKVLKMAAAACVVVTSGVISHPLPVHSEAFNNIHYATLANRRFSALMARFLAPATAGAAFA